MAISSGERFGIDGPAGAEGTALPEANAPTWNTATLAPSSTTAPIEWIIFICSHSSNLPSHFEIDGHGDRVADDRPASFEHAVVDQPELASIHRRRCGGAEPALPPDVFDFRRRALDVEGDFLRHTLD